MKQKLYSHFNSKKGFTLIELLVVIGILAVLAAIAIPAVAGLIDRANVSADKTNSNEMTNALERFASEYELYKNDIAMGIIPSDDLDTMQGRVFNVIGATTKAEITELETLGSDNAILINGERYPTTDALTKKVVEVYTKTSSSTFEPKQSDKCFWYSPECGLVVVAGHNSSVLEKNALVVSGKDAKGNDLTADTTWIDLTPVGSDNVDNGGETPDEGAETLNLIPQGGRLRLVEGPNSTTLIGDGETVEWPDMSGDLALYKSSTFTYQGLQYSLNYIVGGGSSDYSTYDMAWHVTTKNPVIPLSDMATEWNGIPVVGLQNTYSGAGDAEYEIPSNFISLRSTFASSGLTKLPILPEGTMDMYRTFYGDSSLTTIPDGFKIPASVERLDETFYNCTSLTGNLVIEGHPATYRNAFKNVDFEAQGLHLIHNCGNPDCTLVEDLMATNGLS